jgi:hypothetical protein
MGADHVADQNENGFDGWWEALERNTRGWLDYWYWRDKPAGELGAASAVLEEADVHVEGLRSRGNEDPPDCEGRLAGQRCGIEVVELVHRPTLEQSIAATRSRRRGKEPRRPEVYFVWERDDLLSALQDIIDAKDRPKNIKGGPYHRYLLVIVTDEFFLYRDQVAHFLEGATFRAGMISDAYLGLSYHPSLEPGGGRCPVFHLPITRR